ncbi:IS21 family transposase [Acaryochloris sp. CCMEE 5410]|uniref:IS21 family transposase n=1 Tax=Acaryochloris sp. CCMEE 5410 TaxID=310037 RepID=UPI0021D2BA0E|nr:IS21 family transposase [Acaryochloris sp. CCMEE 5410]KAI9129382.1 IS21 family transposase [Acaryochloris sp. CCMEE 5410]
MAYKRQGATLSMSKFREIIRLHELGHNKSEIARSCFISRTSVRDYLRRAQGQSLSYDQLSQLSDSDIQHLLGKGQRQSSRKKPAIDFEYIHREMQRKGVTLGLLWMEGKERGDWNCSYSGFCRRYRQWKKQHSLSMRQTHKGAEKIFVDYCGMTVPVVHPKTGEVTQAQVFVACCGASNYTYAEATESQIIKNWLGSHQRALAFFGGVPVAIVPDNLKSGVTDPCRYEPGINRSYQDFAEHYNVIILPARPKCPRDKPKVENAVQQVERHILAPLRDQTFTSFKQLNEAIAAGLEKLNHRTMKSYGLSRRELFEQVDQPELRPLPSLSFEFGEWKSAKVSFDYHIEVNRHYYSVPYGYVGQSVSVKITESLVQIFHDHQRIAVHERSSVSFQHSTQEGHMPPAHLAHKNQSRETFITWAQNVGPATKQQVIEIFEKKAHDEQAFRALKGVQHLRTTHGAERLEAACNRANAMGMVGQRYLKSMLQHKLESDPLPDETHKVIPIHHANVRGSEYYQAT